MMTGGKGAMALLMSWRVSRCRCHSERTQNLVFSANVRGIRRDSPFVGMTRSLSRGTRIDTAGAHASKTAAR